MVAASSEKYKFEADINSMMSMMSDSIYTHPSACIRELISNACDATDKLRIKSYEDHSLLDQDPDCDIKLIPSPDDKTLTIIDKGIGMTKQDLIKCLGNMGYSGTRKFSKHAQDNGKSAETTNLIGQFGIGFYSAYLIAYKVEVISKYASSDEVAHKWTSSDSEEFTVEECPDAGITRGTKIILHLKDGHEDYSNESKLEEFVKKHSCYVGTPVKLLCRKTKEVDDEDDAESEADKDKPAEEKDGALEEVKEEEKKEKKKKTVHYEEYKQVNAKDICWMKNPKEVTEEEYAQCYKTIAKKWEAPLFAKLYNIDGNINFKLLIFIHKSPSNDPFMQSSDSKGAIHARLFCRNVALSEYTKANPFLEPSYQSFCYVVVDCADLPKNIAREGLTSIPFTKLIAKITKNRIHMLIKEILKGEKGDEFYKKFEQVLKIGVTDDALKKDDFLSYLKFKHSLDDSTTTLKEYCAKAKELKQDKIYIISGKAESSMDNSIVKKLKSKGIDVLLFDSALDDMLANKVQNFDGMRFQDVTKDGFTMEMTEDEKAELNSLVESNKPFVEKAKAIVKEHCPNVEISNISDSPFFIKIPSYGPSCQLENLQNAQLMMGNEQMSFMTNPPKTLCVNPMVPAAKSIIAKVMNDESMANELLLICTLTALMKQGYNLKKPENFAMTIEKILHNAMTASVPESMEVAKDVQETNTVLDEVD